MPSGTATADPFLTAPAPSRRAPPPPAPLREGEHVLCAVVPAAGAPRVDAVVVALDAQYRVAAARFRAAAARAAAPVDLDAPQPAFPAADGPRTHALRFREAADVPHGRDPHKTKKRRTAEVEPLPPAVEAFAQNGHIKPAAEPAPHPIRVGKVYVHFSARDRRLDRWVPAAELRRATESALAEAASTVVENTLVDNAVQAEFAVADTGKRHTIKLTRARRRQYEEINPVSERDVGCEVAARLEKAREEMTKVRNISSIVLGEDHIDAWYYSPYPGKYGQVDKLYICRYCLKYTRSERCYVRHCTACTWIGPPGLKIYDDPVREVAVIEVDGQVSSDYCQRLCLLGKLFLDHKTLYFDVSPFLFYIVTVNKVLAGFFSKEKPACHSDFNLACILTLPQHQRKGVGRFLISLSYELTKREGKTASPERPLSDLGQLSYRSYWAYTIAQFLRSKEGTGRISTKEVAQATGIRLADVTASLKSMNLVSMWKGEIHADTTARALDAAEKKIRKPRLPLRSDSLFVSQDRIEALNQALTSRSRRRRPRKESETPNLTARKSKADATNESPSNLTSHRVAILRRFVQTYSVEELKAKIGSNIGVSSDDLRALAESLDMSMSSCRSQVIKMAEARERLSYGTRSPLQFLRSPHSNETTFQEQSVSPYPRARREIFPEDDDALFVAGSRHDGTPPRRWSNGRRYENGYAHYNGTTPVRHPVNANVGSEALYTSSFTHGADENGISDILVQDRLRAGLLNGLSEGEEERAISSARPMKRQRIRSRKHDAEVVVINSPPP